MSQGFGHIFFSCVWKLLQVLETVGEAKEQLSAEPQESANDRRKKSGHEGKKKK